MARLSLRQLPKTTALLLVITINIVQFGWSADSAKAMSMMAEPLVAPLFFESGAFSSSLVLVNAIDRDTFADVSLRSLEGTLITKQRISIPPFGARTVPLKNLLATANSDVTSGSIVVKQSPDLEGMVVLAQLSITYTGASKTAYIDEELTMADPSGSQTLRGVARTTGHTALLGITSLSNFQQTISVNCIRNHGANLLKTVTLNSQATVILSACDDSHLTSPEDVRSNALKGGELHAIGIQVTTSGGPNTYAAFGVSTQQTPTGLVFDPIAFNDPALMRSASAIYTGVPIGSTSLFRMHAFTPQLAATNFSPRPARVIVKLSQPDTSPVVVATSALTALSSSVISLPVSEGDADMRNSLIVTADGSPGEVVTNMGSASKEEVVDLLAKDSLDPNNSGVHPWDISKGAEATLFLFNHTDQQQRASVMIADGHSRPLWRKMFVLEPFITRAWNIRTLVDSSSVDDLGNALPKDITEGQIEWAAISGGRITGRVLLSDDAMGMARNFSCAAYNALCSSGGSITPSSAAIQLGNSTSFGGNPSWCVSYSSTGCGGSCCGSGAAEGSWSTSAPSELTIPTSCSGSMSCSVTGASPGLPSLTVHMAANGCTQTATASVTVGCGDTRGYLVQEYNQTTITDVTTGLRFMPTCANFSQSAHSVYFSFTEINTPCPSQGSAQYSWALVRTPLIAAASSGYGLDAWRTDYGSSRIVNSGYRDPTQNTSCGGVGNSRHLFGDATDLRNQTGTTTEWNAMYSAAQQSHADYIEPSTGPCGYACVHADWRNHSGGYAP